MYFMIFLLVLGQRQRLYHVLWGSAWFSFLHLALVPSAWARLALNLPCSLCPQRKPFLFGSFLSSPLGFVSAKISVQTSSLVTTSPWSPPPCHLQALIASLLWSVILAISTCSPSSQSSSAPSQYLEQSLAGVEKYTHRILSFQGWDVFVAYQNIYNNLQIRNTVLEMVVSKYRFNSHHLRVGWLVVMGNAGFKWPGNQII